MLTRVRVFSVVTTGALVAVGMVGVPSAVWAVTTAKAFDFNGDGYRDVVYGSHTGSVNSLAGAGFITVVPGSASGADVSKKKTFNQDSPGVPGGSEVGDHWGRSYASADFDRDGYADLAIGAPEEDISYYKPGETTATAAVDGGCITIIYGSATGLSQRSVTIGEPPADAEGTSKGPGENHRFGLNLLVGDFDGDGIPTLIATSPGVANFYDLAVGAGTTLAARSATSTVEEGTYAPPSQAYKLPTTPITTTAAKTAVKTVAALTVAMAWYYPSVGDANGDGIDDLVLGWADDDPQQPGGPPKYGVAVYPGGAPILLPDSPPHPTKFENPSPPIAMEAMGETAVGDFNGDGKGDVAVGQPGDSPALGGRVVIFPGTAEGVDSGSSYSFSQDTGAIPDTGETADGFGAALSVGDANGDGKADLAVGASKEDVGSVVDGGMAWILYGGATGLTDVGSRAFSQGAAGVPGTAETNDQFGYQVSLFDVDNNGRDDYIAGAPTENGTEGIATILKSWTTTTTTSQVMAASSLGVANLDAEIGVRISHL